MLLIMVIMYTTAHHKIRRQCFEAFWYTHHLAFFFMIALYTHATGCFVRDTADPDYIATFPFYSTEHCLGYLSWRFIIWPGILYFGERVWREIRARRATRLSKVLVHPSGPFVSPIEPAVNINRSNYHRRHGVTDHQTKFQICSRPVALRPGSGCLQVSVASCELLALSFAHQSWLVYAFPLCFSSRSPPRQTTLTFLCTSARLATGPKLLESVSERAHQSSLRSLQLR